MNTLHEFFILKYIYYISSCLLLFFSSCTTHLPFFRDEAGKWCLLYVALELFFFFFLRFDYQEHYVKIHSSAICVAWDKICGVVNFKREARFSADATAALSSLREIGFSCDVFRVALVPRTAASLRLHSSSLCLCPSAQINELSHVQIPIMLMPDDFKAYSKIKVDNHLFNKWVSFQSPWNTRHCPHLLQHLTFFFCAKGEHAKSFQVQRILPPGVSEPPGALWHWRPGFLGTETFISTSCLRHQTHCTMTPLSLYPFFLQQSFYSLLFSLPTLPR